MGFWRGTGLYYEYHSPAGYETLIYEPFFFYYPQVIPGSVWGRSLGRRAGLGASKSPRAQGSPAGGRRSPATRRGLRPDDVRRQEPTVQFGQWSPSAFARKTAIWARVTLDSGSNVVGVTPWVIPEAFSASMYRKPSSPLGRP